MSRTTIQSGGSGKHGGGNPAGAAVGVQGFLNPTNYLRSAAGGFLPGSAAGFFASVALHILSVAGGGTLIPQWSGNVAGTRGFGFSTSAGSLFWRAANGAGALISSAGSASGAGDIGEILLLDLVYDFTAGLLRFYRAGVQIGAGVAIVGYTPASGTDFTSLGGFLASGNDCPWARIVGALYGTGIPDAAAILAHYNACKAANTMESMGGAGVVNVNRWQAKDNLPAAVSWADDIGGMVLTKTGTLNSVIFNPVWE